MSSIRRRILASMENEIIWKEYDDRSIPDLNGYIQAATHQINGSTTAGNKTAIVRIDGGDTYELTMNVYSRFRMASISRMVLPYEKADPSVYVISPDDHNNTDSMEGKRETLQIITRPENKFLYIFYWTNGCSVDSNIIRDSISVHNLSCPGGR